VWWKLPRDADARGGSGGSDVMRWDRLAASGAWRAARWCAAFMASLVLAWPATYGQELRRPLRLPQVPGFVTLTADLHVHSVFSDGEVWPTVHVREAWRDGLDVLSLTEHREYRPHAKDLTGGAMRAYEVARPLADRLGVILIPGVEITRPVPGQPSPWPVGSAHFNALYIQDDGPLDAPDLADALGLAKRQGAFLTWNHPAFMGRPAQWYPHVDDVHRRGLFQGIEIVNGDEYSPEAFGWALEKQFTILATSDAHLPMPAHLRSARRPATILFARTRDGAGVRDALEARRTLAWLDDDVWGEEQWVRATWNGALRTAPVPARGGAEFVAAIENLTSISFELNLPAGPVSLSHPTLNVGAAATTLLHGRTPQGLTPGPHRFDIPVEVRNLHSRPGAALSATLALELVVEQ
jgi:hypothetical protein